MADRFTVVDAVTRAPIWGGEYSQEGAEALAERLAPGYAYEIVLLCSYCSEIASLHFGTEGWLVPSGDVMGRPTVRVGPRVGWIISLSAGFVVAVLAGWETAIVASMILLGVGALAFLVGLVTDGVRHRRKEAYAPPEDPR